MLSIYRFVTMSQLLDKVPDVDIDDNGKFKYILINVQDTVNKTSKHIVRGYARAQWHGEFVIHKFIIYIIFVVFIIIYTVGYYFEMFNILMFNIFYTDNAVF